MVLNYVPCMTTLSQLLMPLVGPFVNIRTRCLTLNQDGMIFVVEQHAAARELLDSGQNQEGLDRPSFVFVCFLKPKNFMQDLNVLFVLLKEARTQ